MDITDPVLTAMLEVQRQLGALTSTIQQSLREHSEYSRRINVLEKDHVSERDVSGIKRQVSDVQTKVDRLQVSQSEMKDDITFIKDRMDRPQRFWHRVSDWFKQTGVSFWVKFVGYVATAVGMYFIGFFK